jgi:hypothetical protein
MKGIYRLPEVALSPALLFSPLGEADVAVPSKTEDGEPYVRWRKDTSGFSGWWARGSRGHRPSGPGTFWGHVLSAASELAHTQLDEVHVVGPGVLSLGALGVTVRSSYGAALLHECLLTDPERYICRMAGFIQKTGAYTRICPEAPSGVALADPIGPMLDEQDERHAIMQWGDGKKWSTQQKRVAHVWVRELSRLLRDERMDAAQVAMAELLIPACLPQAAKESLGWPRSGLSDYWQYSLDQQVCWGAFLLFAMGSPKHAVEAARLAAVTEREREARPRLAAATTRIMAVSPQDGAPRFARVLSLLTDRFVWPP